MRLILVAFVIACGPEPVITPDAQRLPLCRELGCEPQDLGDRCGASPSVCVCNELECEPEAALPPTPPLGEV